MSHVANLAFWLAGITLVVSLACLVLLTAATLKSPRWATRLHAVAITSVQSMGIPAGDYTSAEEAALDTMLLLGQPTTDSPAPDAPDDLTLLCALLNLPRTPELEAEIEERQNTLLEAAVTRHHRYFARSNTPQWRARWWTLAGFVSTAHRTIAAVQWLIPRARRLSAEGESTIAKMTFRASILTLIAAPFITRPFSSSNSADSTDLVGYTATIAAAVAVMHTVATSARRLQNVLQMSTRRVLLSLGLIIALVALSTVMTSEAALRWQKAHLAALDDITLSNAAGRAIPLAVAAGLMVLLTLGAVRQARNSFLRTSERVGSVAAAVTVNAVMLFAIIQMLVPGRYTATGSTTVSAVFALSTLTWFAVATTEWIGRRRNLRREGIHVPRGWFRWWALPTWLAVTALSTPALNLLSSIDVTSANPTVQIALILTSIAATLVLTLGSFAATIIGFVVTLRYIRRVDRTHRAAQAHRAAHNPDTEPHPA